MPTLIQHDLLAVHVGHEETRYSDSRLINIKYRKRAYVVDCDDDRYYVGPDDDITGMESGIEIHIWFTFQTREGPARHHFIFGTERFDPEYFNRWLGFIIEITDNSDIKDSLIYHARRCGLIMKDLIDICLDQPLNAASA